MRIVPFITLFSLLFLGLFSYTEGGSGSRCLALRGRKACMQVCGMGINNQKDCDHCCDQLSLKPWVGTTCESSFEKDKNPACCCR